MSSGKAATSSGLYPFRNSTAYPGYADQARIHELVTRILADIHEDLEVERRGAS
jgi:hypothetical protein